MKFLAAHNRQSTSLQALKQAPPLSSLFRSLLSDMNNRQVRIYSKLLLTDFYQYTTGSYDQPTQRIVAQLDSLFQCL